MPRKPRIDIAGYYHVINRGVEKRVVFVNDEDFEKFEELLCDGAVEFSVRIHNYALMSNHIPSKPVWPKR
ncbi:transposase [Nitratifractor sp.]